MLLIVAATHDEVAATLAARWKSDGAALLTSRDLSAPGWEFRVPARGASRGLAGGRAFSSSDLSGVLALLPAVYSWELDHVAVEDRGYVSTEMTSFLLAWLSSLECPILNRPTPGCLCGPAWRIEQWLQLAARLGIPVHPLRRSTSAPATEDRYGGIPVSIVGEQCVGAVDPSLAGYARRLAAAAQVEMLNLWFTNAQPDGRLLNVSLCPDPSQPELAEAIFNYFEARATH